MRFSWLLIIALLAAVSGTARPWSGVSPTHAATDLTWPFKSGRTWVICRGYDYASHANEAAFDLVVDGDGPVITGCPDGPAQKGLTVGRSVTSAADGTIASVNGTIICVNITGTSKSYQVIHVNPLIHSGAVIRGVTVLGTAQPQTPGLYPGNNNVAHVHFEMFAAINCTGNSVPFDQSAGGMNIDGVPYPRYNPIPVGGEYFGRKVSRTTSAANGTLLGQVTFKTPCPSGIGVGVAFDGTNLWYSCYASSPDLYKASPTTGQVLASYNVATGLGALAWDEGRKKIWAGAGCGTNQTGAEIYLIDPAQGTGAVKVRVPNFSGTCLDDGLAYDGSNDTLYHSFDGATAIRHVSAVTGSPVGDDRFAWAGNGCYNSGLAIGGNLLYEGSDGCTHIWVVDKNTKAHQFDFASPGLRDEGMSCDSSTFPGTTAMWSKDAYNNTAYAFTIPLGSCNFGGIPQPPSTNRNIVFVQGIDSTGDCSGANTWIQNYLQSSQGRSWFNAITIGKFLSFNYNGGSYDCASNPPQPVYAHVDTCHGIALEASRLQAMINAQSGTTKVTIFAHSMGGLISAYLVATQASWAKQHIASVMTFDSPLKGISDFAADNWDNNTVRSWFHAATACTKSTDLTSVEEMRWSSSIVQAAASAARVVPFYPLDATKFIDWVPRDDASLNGARAFSLIDSCSQPGANQNTCEPPLPVQDDHGTVWNRRYDGNNVDKAFLAGCAAQAMFDCSFLVAPVTQNSVSSTQISISPDDSQVRFVSSFGSVIRMSLIAPDGTVYGPDGAGNVLAYGVDNVSETYEIANPLAGKWTIKLNGLDVPGGTEDVGIALFVEAVTPTPTSSAPLSIVFGHVTSAGTNDDSDAGAINGTTARLNGGGTLQSLSVYVGQTSPGAHLRMALYALDSAGHPGQLLTQTGEVTTTMGWNTIPVPVGTTLTPGVYWIVAQTDDPHTVYRVASAGPATSVGWAYRAYGAFPAAVTGWLDFGSQAFDMYGTVTASQLAFGHVTSSGTNDDSDAGAINGTTARLNGAGTLQSLSVYVGQTSPGAHLRMALYALDSSGHPGQLLTQTAEVAAAAGWNTIPVPAGTTLTPGEYWVVAQTDDPHTVYRVASTGPGSSVGWSYQAYGAFPAAVTGWLDFGSQALDMYGTVTPSQLAFGRVTSSGTNDDSDAGAINGTTARLNGSGTLQSLSVYVGQTSPGAHLRMALYALDSSGHPGQLLTQTTEAAATAGWNTIPVPAGTTLTPGEYWITAQTDDPHTVYRVASASPASSVGWSYRAYGAFPAAITGWLDFGSQAFDMYATLD